MRSSLSASIFIVVVASAASAPQIDDAQSLVQSGDVLANGWEVDLIRSPAMSDRGDWAAILDTSPGAFEMDSVIYVGGQIMLEEGATLSTGEVIGNIFGVDYSPSGSLAWTHRVDPGGGVTEERLYVDGIERLRTGGVISGPGIPSGTILNGIYDLRYEAPYVLLRARIRPGGSGSALAIVLVDLTVPSAPSLSMCAYVGQTIAPLPGPLTSVILRGDVASDGTYAFPVSYDDAGTTKGAILTDQGFFAIHGDPIPGTSWNWAFLNLTFATCSAGGSYVVSASAASSTSIGLGVIVSSSGVLAQENMPIAAAPGLSAGYFDGKWLGMSTAGEVAFVVPQPGNVDTLIAGGQAILVEGTDTVSGSAVSSLSAGFGDRVAVGSEGRDFLLVTYLANGESALTLVEPEVGIVESGCTTVSNSTGAPGGLRALGTSITSANDLVVESYDTPPGQFGLLLASTNTAFVSGAGGSLGNLCLGGAIGRFNADVAAADPSGVIRTPLDLTMIPQPAALATVQSGETWQFQRWHRDIVGGAAASNYTSSLSVTFR